MKKNTMAMALLLTLTSYHVNAKCHWHVHTYSDGVVYRERDYIDILFVVNNASDKWMYLWMSHPKHGEDNGNFKPKAAFQRHAHRLFQWRGLRSDWHHCDARARTSFILLDVDKPAGALGVVTMHTWKGGCYVAWDDENFFRSTAVHWSMSKMASGEGWSSRTARVRIDCV